MYVKRIYLARDLSQAQLVVDLLEQRLIPAYIENAHQSGGLGELAVSYPEVWIRRDQDELRARDTIDLFEARSLEPLAELFCPKCGESNPASFELCWSCGSDLD